MKNNILNHRVIAGCMRLNSLDINKAENFINNAISLGVTFFDHADIYGRGECESIFGQVLDKNKALRQKIIIQTKCGIIPGKMYDLSKEHIIESVENSLTRLKTDYVDSLLLHRPDALVEPQEVNEAFDILYKSGKVLNFGVSNHTPNQIKLLKKYVNQPLKFNQLQLSITNSSMISSGIEANIQSEGAIDRDGGVLDYCRLNDIKIQVWSPLQYGTFNGTFLGNEKFKELNTKLDEIAEKYTTKPSTIAAAWILRHPAKMQIISGTTNPIHLKEIVDAQNINLTRQEWYDLYISAGHMLP